MAAVKKGFKRFIQRVSNKGGSASPVFGLTLETIMMEQSSSATGYVSSVPLIIDRTIDYLVAEGLDVTGIFRVPASLRKVRELKAAFDKEGDVDLYAFGDVMAAAAVLKQFLRELEDAPLTGALYDDFLRAQQATDEADRVREMGLVVQRLPAVNKAVAMRVLEFLRLVASHAEANKMTLENLAIVFGQNLLRPAKEDEADVMELNMAAILDAGMANGVVLTLLQHYEAIFQRTSGHAEISDFDDHDPPPPSGGPTITGGESSGDEVSRVSAVEQPGGDRGGRFLIPGFEAAVTPKGAGGLYSPGSPDIRSPMLTPMTRATMDNAVTDTVAAMMHGGATRTPRGLESSSSSSADGETSPRKVLAFDPDSGSTDGHGHGQQQQQQPPPHRRPLPPTPEAGTGSETGSVRAGADSNPGQGAAVDVAPGGDGGMAPSKPLDLSGNAISTIVDDTWALSDIPMLKLECKRLAAEVKAFEESFAAREGRPAGEMDRVVIASTVAKYNEFSTVLADLLERNAAVVAAGEGAGDDSPAAAADAGTAEASAAGGSSGGAAEVAVPPGGGASASKTTAVFQAPASLLPVLDAYLADPLLIAQQRLQEARIADDRPYEFAEMTAAQLQREKSILKKELRTYNTAYKTRYGLEPVKAAKEPMRPLYERYRLIKELIDGGGGVPAELVASSSAPSIDGGPSAAEGVGADAAATTATEPAAGIDSRVAAALGTAEADGGEGRRSASYIDVSVPLEENRIYLALKREKRALQVQLHEYQAAFMRTHGRKVAYIEDREPVQAEYMRYKSLKAQIKTIEEEYAAAQ